MTLGLFLIMLSFNLKNFNNLSDLKKISNNKGLNLYFLCFLLSLAGIPPLMGFFGKLYIFSILLEYSNYFLIIFSTILNFFSIYFYTQNFRFSLSNLSFIKNKIINDFVFFFLINVLMFINLSVMLYIDFIFIKLNNLFFHLLF